MKAATSTICAYLEGHGDAFMVPRAEPNYFSHDANFDKGPQWYETYFAEHTSEGLCGEGSNDYAARDLYPDTAARMAAYNPDMKIIYMVRDPLARIISAWIQNRADSGDMVPPTPDKAVQMMPDLFVGQSRYWHNIAPYRKHFGDAQIFVGFMEDLNRNPDRFYRELCGFLQIAPVVEDSGAGHLNKSAGKRVPSPAYTTLNKMPMVGLAKALLPTALKRTVRERFLSRRIDEKPDFSPQVRAEVASILVPDAAAFLDHYGKPADFWKLS